LVEIDPRRHEEAVTETLKSHGRSHAVKAIFEASFSCDGVRVKVDILERLGNGKWSLTEVKSSTGVKDEYLPDVGVQYNVLKGVGVDIKRVTLLHLNNQYVYDGNALNLEQLFTASDLTRETLACQWEVERKLQKFKDCLASPQPPEIAPSRHCFTPMSASSLVTAALCCPSTGWLSLSE
jgi:hypothetical protein